jgi:hypothetical protein
MVNIMVNNNTTKKYNIPKVTCKVICKNCNVLDEYTGEKNKTLKDAESRQKGHIGKTGHVVYIEIDEMENIVSGSTKWNVD